MPEVEPRLPDDPRLRQLVSRAVAELAGAAPLGAALLTGRSPGLPDGGLLAYQRESQQLGETASELDGLTGHAGDDELDRLALANALHRVSGAASPRPPGRPLLLDRPLLPPIPALPPPPAPPPPDPP